MTGLCGLYDGTMGARIAKLENEQIDLETRINKLVNFLSSRDSDSISEKQKALLAEQLEAMNKYNRILVLRINDLKGL